eukprot:TRINITY_DN486_c0_g1_i4.p1 TRINITY_DN486_c0_g1~~TRINITY_DN486_c0_g1_i4.p1  ORF type:complete len:368 (-),score=67.24 TRINITY_DN486_c0_g1_i4:561-1664(-)
MRSSGSFTWPPALRSISRASDGSASLISPRTRRRSTLMKTFPGERILYSPWSSEREKTNMPFIPALTCTCKGMANLRQESAKNVFFSVEYHGGYIALRDYDGQYLSPIGSRAVLKTRSNSVTKDELFSLEDSLPQAAFVAVSNSKHVSVKQGVDVTANQDEISDHETFQMEYEDTSKQWYIRTMQDKYFTVQSGGGIQANESKRSPNALFLVEWHNDGTISFKANNGKYVGIKKSGHLFANVDALEDSTKYFFYLVNRPILVLKCEQGFVGYKAAGSPKLECNKASYETIVVERGEKGQVFFKGQNGKYLSTKGDGLNADSDSPVGFYLELRDPTRMCIKAEDGQYLNSEKNGLLALSNEEPTQWEY